MADKLKKSCDGCRALDGLACSLGYKTHVQIKQSSFIGGFTYKTLIPIEPCPKPRTYNQYIYHLKYK